MATDETEREDRENRERLGPVYSYNMYAEDTGKHIFTVSASLDNEEDREATEAACRVEAHRRLQDGDWVQDSFYFLG
jgi:hypothetical protein